jgi:hypothetical protein
MYYKPDDDSGTQAHDFSLLSLMVAASKVNHVLSFFGY